MLIVNSVTNKQPILCSRAMFLAACTLPQECHRPEHQSLLVFLPINNQFRVVEESR